MTKWTINSTLNEWNDVLIDISKKVKDSKFDDEFIASLELALDELFANISMYAYGGSVGGVEISLCIHDNVVKTIFKDKGIPFNPILNIASNIPAKSSKGQKGGWGVFIAKQQVNSIEYYREDDTNILCIIKNKEKISMDIIKSVSDNKTIYTLNGEELLSAKIIKDATTKEVYITGAIKTLIAPCFEEVLNTCLIENANFVLDFSSVSYIASAGLRVLLNMQEKIDDTGTINVKIRNITKTVKDVFDSTGFSTILDIED